MTIDQAAPAPVPQTDARPVYAIFQGGGAKGVSHVGALAALEANHLEIVGAAGASAGAIVAALSAVGLSARDILDPRPDGGDILKANDCTPTSLLGEDAWERLGHLRERGDWLAGTIALGGVGLGLLLWPGMSRSARGVLKGFGHLDTSGIRELVNTVLHKRLCAVHAAHDAPPPPARITFDDIDPGVFPELRSLKIVATDLSNRRLAIFDRDRTPAVEVAHAVTASMAIPVVFKPVSLPAGDGKPDALHVDGGLVSNLPIWLFAEEKLAFERTRPNAPPVPIVGFTLQGAPWPELTKKRRPLPPFFDFLRNVAETALSAGQSVAQEFVQDLVIVPLETGLELLSFDRPRSDYVRSYVEGFDCADRHMRQSLVLKPERVQEALGDFYNRARIELDAALERLNRPPVNLLRVNLTERFGQRAFRVTFSFNMDADADDRLELDWRGRGVARAFESGTFEHAPVGEAWSDPRLDYMTKYERALLRPGVRSVISTPIFETVAEWERAPAERGAPAGVLSLDSDTDLAAAFDDIAVKDLLATRSVIFYDVLKAEQTSGRR